MRTLKVLVVLALMPAVCGCSLLGDFFGRPTVEGVKPRITGIGLDSVDLTLDIAVNNPYIVPIVTPRFRYGLDIEEHALIQSKETAFADLPASSVGTVSLPIHLKFADLGAVYNTLKDAKQFNYKMHGTFLLTAMGKTLELPVSHTGTLPVLRPPKFSNFKVNFSDITLKGATVTVEADMINPNIFALGLDQVGYGLSLGQTKVGALTASTAGQVPADGGGRIKLTGRIDSAGALLQLIRGAGLGKPELSATGFVDTPYGKASLKR